MSSFRDEFLKSRMAKLPVRLPEEEAVNDGQHVEYEEAEEEEEEEEELDDFDVGAMASTSREASNFLKPRTRLSGTAGSTTSNSGRASNRGLQQDYTPLSGQGYFETALSVSVRSQAGALSSSDTDDSEDKETFRVYYTPPSAGHLARDSDDDDDDEPVVFVCHHGAGYSAMSFALLAKTLSESSGGKAGVLALDVRGHGKTTVKDETNMDINVLADDLSKVLQEVFPVRSNAPNLVLVGHSMGGSVVVKACSAIQEKVAPVLGVVNLDVVEGTAMEFLDSMMDVISQRPKGFDSLEDAIRWHVRTKTIANPASARVSVPPLFTTTNVGSGEGTDATQGSGQRRFPLVWRTDLKQTQPYWEGWFHKLSSSFLSQRCAKLLVLAGAEALDKDLMIGQMQGKYQLTVFQDVGHCLQEDAPERLADVLLEFWRRNQVRDILKGVKKVGER